MEKAPYVEKDATKKAEYGIALKLHNVELAQVLCTFVFGTTKVEVQGWTLGSDPTLVFEIAEVEVQGRTSDSS
ncbi:hypothetical protein Tco_1079576 [Tanacetum coccineum]|uniref:Uncharacterized protein n=1 Tax=Tanacetum coccineum TaxID=301880 RepID=A0ABQ5HTB6_9ASTR